MGNSCPSGFERGPGFSCHAQCPGKFKYSSEQPVERCIYALNNQYSFNLRTLPPLPPRGPQPPEYAAELTRVKEEHRRVLQQIQTNAPAHQAISVYKDVRAESVQKYGSLRSQYASYNAAREAGNAIAAVTQTLKPMRPPTAPADDIQKEKRALSESSAPNFLLFQVALVVLLICLLIYLFVPAQYAHGIVVLVLSVGIAVGIFLTK